jgi:hypothetical protein
MPMNLNQERSKIDTWWNLFLIYWLKEWSLPVSLGANLSYIYIRGEYMWVYKILERAIAEAKAADGW